MTADDRAGFEALAAERLRPAIEDSLWDLQLLDTFAACRRGRRVSLGIREQRLVALLGVSGIRPRSSAAGALWPEATEARAMGSLRAAIWHVQRAAPGLLSHDRHCVGLGDRVRVDIDDLVQYAAQAMQLADSLRSTSATMEPARYRPWLTALTSGELLSEWYEDWLVTERARLQLAKVQALEALADHLVNHGDLVTAMHAAMGARAIDPLRESARRAVIRVYVAEGNHHAAVQEYLRYEARLARELGVVPSAQLAALIHPLRRTSVRPAVRHSQPAM